MFVLSYFKFLGGGGIIGVLAECIGEYLHFYFQLFLVGAGMFGTNVFGINYSYYFKFNFN